jgi:hypothetical protein
MSECCIPGCDRPGTVHANHPDASLYCPEHGVCPHCHESVEFFVHCDLDVWICPCVEKRRKEKETQRPEYNPLGIVGKKPRRVRPKWQRPA